MVSGMNNDPLTSDPVCKVDVGAQVLIDSPCNVRGEFGDIHRRKGV